MVGKTLHYGVAGEGRGHAARALALIEQLHERHRVVAYSFGQGLKLLKPACASLGVEVRALPPLEFRYTSRRTLSYTKTFFSNVGYLSDLSDIFSGVQRDMERDQPDLVISDFEPVLPRVARRLQIPFINVDHQHFLLACDPNELPSRFRPHSRWMAAFVRMFCAPGPAETVISSFFRYRTKARYAFTKQVGCMLRRRILQARPEDRGHLSVYVRRPKSVEMIEPLRELGIPAHVYGLGARERQGNVRFFDIHPERFLEDLATSTALITTAGNQLVGEALYLGKPILAVPEPDNKEQEINAHYVATMGVGQAMMSHRLSTESLTGFVEGTDFYRERIHRQRMCGNEVTLRIIEDHLHGVFASAMPSRTVTARAPAPAVA